MIRPKPGIRMRLLLTIVGAVAATLVLAIVAFEVYLEHQLGASATQLAETQARAEAANVRFVAGRVTVKSEPSPGSDTIDVWVLDGDRVIERPRVSAAIDAVAERIGRGPAATVTVGEGYRLASVPIVLDGVRRGSVVSGVSLTPYEQSAHLAVIAALIAAIALLAAITLIAQSMLGRALSPVASMTADAAAWSERDLDRRFDQGRPYDEITELAATLDGLLDRIATQLRHEQRFTAEISHELRTPLARISAEAELMLTRARTDAEYRSALGAIQRNAGHMIETVDALMAAARDPSGGSAQGCDARDAVAAAVAHSRAHTSREIEYRRPADPLMVDIPRELVGRIVQPLLDNAVKYCRAHVRVDVSGRGDRVIVAVRDDGPGIDPDERDTIFAPGVRGSASATAAVGGAGLGLALARRLVASVGGSIEAVDGDGAHLLVDLPAARRFGQETFRSSVSP